MLPAAAIHLVIFAAATASALPAGPTAEVTTVAGEAFTGRLVRIEGGEAEFLTSAGSRKVPLRDLWRIRLARAGEVMTSAGAVVVALAAPKGAVLRVDGLSIADGRLHGHSALLGRFSLEMSRISAVYLPGKGQSPDDCRKALERLELPAGRRDYLLAEDQRGKLVPVPGVLKGISGGKVAFEFAGRERTMDLAAVRAIQLARVATPASRPVSLGRLVGRDGSVVPFTAITADGSRMTVTGPGLEASSTDLAAVAEIAFDAGRCVYLSELKPLKVAQVGLFDVVFPLGIDRSSAGGPIRLGGRSYARGLGLHSRCEVSYELDGNFAAFAALAGIDDAGGNRGNATLKLLGDGRELIKPLNLTAADGAVSIRCDLTGVKVLTILVDFGPDGVDVGDHVSLAEARLIKP